MQETCETSEGSMAAIIGGEEDRVLELAAVADVDVANINAPGQIVLSGESSKIILAVSLAKEYSARKAVELTVAGAFHSRLMEPALSDALGRSCRNTHEFARVPVVCNVLAGFVGRIRKGTPVISISNSGFLDEAIAALCAI